MKTGANQSCLLFVFLMLCICFPAFADDDLNLDWMPIPGTGMVKPVQPHEPGRQPPGPEGPGIDFGYLVVEVSPAGARLSIDGEERTPGFYQVSVGPHLLRVEKDLYHSYEKTVAVGTGDTKSISVQLKPAFGTLAVSSDPSGAEVRISGIRVGTTPYKDEKVRSGRYRVSLNHRWYDDWSKTIVVKDRETTRVQADLPPNFGTLTITGTPSNVSVTIDGKPVPDARNVRLLPGHHRVKLKAPHHFPAEKTVSIAGGKQKTLRYTLKPQQGAISVESTPYGADILLDGEKTGKKTPSVLTKVMAGPHTVKVQKKDHQPIEARVTVENGGVEAVRVTLQTGHRVAERDGVYVLLDNGVVRDARTGLEWKAGPDKDMDWNEARSWVQNLGEGWRMPTVDELEGLYKKGTGSRNMTPLLKTTGWTVWSGETKGSSVARYFDFTNGSRSWDDRGTSYNERAFAVRSRSDG